jgi:ribosomal protein S18 acetylase RimI-like enzyme
MIEYKIENDLSIEEFRTVLVNSTLGQRRPVDDPERLSMMLEHGNLIITAREEGKLIGISRSLTDFTFCTYMSDLAVDEAYQKHGIGRELIRQTKLAAPTARLILLSAPAAVSYYPRIGMKKFDHCYLLDDISELK